MPIVVTNAREADNPVVFANDAFCTLTRYEREKIVGSICRFLQGAGTDPASITLMRDAVQAEQRVDIEIRNDRKDGQAFWNRLQMVQPHNVSGALTYFIASRRGVTPAPK